MSVVSAGRPPQTWTWMTWLLAIAIVFVLHVALIFIFGSRKGVPPKPVKNVLSLALASDAENKRLALNDATLFALPDPNGFAGQMWVAMRPLSIGVQNWSEDPQWLAQTNPALVAALGSGFGDFMHTNRFTSVHFEFHQSPPLAAPAIVAQPSAPESSLQIQGEITKRPLQNPMKLPAWPSTDIIAPTKVQVLVDAAGDVVSATLLPPENFSEEAAVRDDDADQYALKVARTARFAPLSPNAASIESSPTTRLAVGQLIFNWQAVPVTAANPGH